MARQKQCITPGDVIVQVNGHAITSYEQAITLLRESWQQQRVVVFASRPPAPPPLLTLPISSSSNGVSNATPNVVVPGKVRKQPTNSPSAQSAQLQTPKKVEADRTPPLKTMPTDTRGPPAADATATSHTTTTTTPKKQKLVLPPTPDISWGSPDSLDVSLIQSADDLVLLSSYPGSRRHQKQQQQQSRHMLRRFASFDSSDIIHTAATTTAFSPVMVQKTSKQNNDFNANENEEEQVLPVTEMLEHDFGRDTLQRMTLLQQASNSSSIRKGTHHNDSSNTKSASFVATIPTARQQQDESSNLQRQLEIYKEQLAQSEKSSASAKQQWDAERQALWKKLQDKDKQLQQVKEESFARQQSMQAEKENWQQQIQQAQKRQEADQQWWHAETKRWNDELESTQGKVVQLENERNDLLEKHRRDLAQSKQEAHALRQQLAKRQEVVDQLRLDRDGAIHTAQQKTQFAAEMGHKLQSVRAEAQEQQQALVQKLDEAQSQVALVQGEKEKCESTLKNQILALQNELHEMQQARDEAIQVRLDENVRSVERQSLLENELAETRSALSRLQNEVVLKSKLSTENLKEVEEKWQETKRKLDESEQLVQSQRAHFQEREHDLGEKLESMRRDLAAERQDASHAKQQLQDLERQLINSKSQFAHTQKLLEQREADFKSTLDQKTEQLQRLESEQITLQKAQDELLQRNQALENLVGEKENEVSALRGDLAKALDELTASLEQQKAAAPWEREYYSLKESAENDKLKLQDEVEKLHLETERVNNELSSSRQSNVSLSQQVEALNETIMELQTKMEEFHVKERHKDAEIEEATNVIMFMETKLSNAEDELSTYLCKKREIDGANITNQQHLATLRLEISGLKQSLEEAVTRNQILRREKENLSASNSTYLERIEALQDKVDDCIGQLSEKSSEIMSIRGSLSDTRMELQQKVEELRACKKAFTQLQVDRDALAKKVESEREITSRYNKSLTEELIEAQQELSESKQCNQDLDRLMRSMRRNLTDSERRASVAREQIEIERKNSNDLKEQLKNIQDEMEIKLEKTSKEISELREANLNGHEERKQLKREADHLKLECEQLKKDIQAATESHRTKVQCMSTENSELRTQCTRQEKEISSLSTRLLDAKAEAEQAHRENSDLRRRNTETIHILKDEFNQKFNRQNSLLQEKEKELRVMKKVQEEISIVRRELLTTQQSLQRSNDESEFLSTLLDEVREECSAKIDDLSRSHKVELDRITSLKSQTEQDLCGVTRKFDEAQKTISELQERQLKDTTEREKITAEKNILVEETSRQKEIIEQYSNELGVLKSEIESITNERQSLRSQYEEIAGVLQSEQIRLREMQNSLSSQKEHCSQLSEQRSALLNETKMLSDSLDRLQSELRTSNEARDDALNAVRQEKAENSRLYESLRKLKEDAQQRLKETKHSQAEVTSLRVQLDEATSEKSRLAMSLKSEINALEKRQKEADKTLREVQNEAKEARSIILSLTETQSELELTLGQVQAERDSLLQENEEASSKIESLAKEIADERMKLSEEIAKRQVALETTLEEVVVLKNTIKESEATLDEKSKQILSLSSEVDSYSDKLKTLTTERDEALSSLKQAMHQAKSFKVNVTELEDQIAELERCNTLLTSQVESHRETISKLEESSSASIEFRSKQVKEMELKVSALETERERVLNTVDSLKDELRESRRQATEQARLVHSLQARVDHVTSSLEESQVKLRCAIQEKDAARTSESETLGLLEDKEREIERLQANVQVLNATITRMKSDNATLQDCARQRDNSWAESYDPRDDEIARLQNKLQSQEAKLTSITDVYKSQQQVLCLSQSLEGQLVRFVEDVLHNVGDSIFDIASDLVEIQDNRTGLLGEDGKASELDEHSLNTLKSFLEKVLDTIPQTKSMLEEKHEQLDAWKRRRTLRLAPDTYQQTPDAKPRTNPESPRVIQALETMKKALNDEILTPYKNQRRRPQTLDADYLQRVVLALESQIDSLLSDLQSANEALRAKDQLFSDLEQLVAHHEGERDSLARKLERARTALQQAETKIKKLEESVAALADKDRKNENGNSRCKKVAVHLLAGMIKHRDNQLRDSVFQQWSNSENSSRSVTQQDVWALSQELATMREKFLILKKHLKKTRRGRGQLQPGLDRILEEKNEDGHGYDTT